MKLPGKSPRQYWMPLLPVMLLIAVFTLSGCQLSNVRDRQAAPTATVPAAANTPRPTATTAPTAASGSAVTATPATSTSNPGAPGTTGGTGTTSDPASPPNTIPGAGTGSSP